MAAALGSIWEPRILSILRIVSGLLLMEHGTNKLFNFPAQPDHKAYVLMTLVPGLAGILEALGGLLLTVGLFTRIVAFILSGEMAFAYFMSHAPQNFYPLLNRGDAAILYCFVFLYLAVAGGGVWSLDQLRAASPPSPNTTSRKNRKLKRKTRISATILATTGNGTTFAICICMAVETIPDTTTSPK